MKSKLTALFLVVLMLFSMFTMTACGDDTTDLTNDVIEPMTITLYSIKGDTTTDESVAQVEKALNRITRNLYNTNLKLVLYTEAEYDAKLAQQMQKAQQSAATTPTNPNVNNDKKVYETVEVNGFVEYVYPDVKEGQLDIFLVRDKTTYQNFVKGGALANLTGLLDSTKFNGIKSHINSSFMEAAKVNGGYYAVPNNHLMGSATYLLLDRAAVDALNFDAQTMTSLSALKGYLEALKADETYADYTPLLNCAEPSTAYVAPGTMIGTALSADKSATANVPTLLLNDADYVDYLATKQAYEQMGYLANGAFDGTQKVGATFVSGIPGAIEALYGEKYYTVRYSEYTASEAELYSSMYVVSKHCVNTSRCVEVLSLLTLNAEFRNIFQYGLEDVHYTVDDNTKDIIPAGNTYVMNPLYTGNEYLLSDCINMDAGYRALRAELTYAQTKAILGDLCQDDEWSGDHAYALAKCLNNSVRFTPYKGLTLTATDNANLATVKTLIATVATEAAALLPAQGDTLDTYIQTLKTFYAGKATALNADAAVIALLAQDNTNSLASRFLAWYK
jgi:hypothetical protein